MSKKDEALKLALEAICGSGDFLFNWHDCEPNNEREMQQYQATLAVNENAFRAIREALAEQPSPVAEPHKQQEPVERGVLRFYTNGIERQHWKADGSIDFKDEQGNVTMTLASGEIEAPIGLYALPASKPWVGLTDVEWMNIVNKDHAWFGRQPDEVAHEVAKLVEAKLQEKNA